MDLILNSNFDAQFKQVLLKAFDHSMKEVLSDASAGYDLHSLESLAAEAILELAGKGQTSPGQLQRHAVYRVKSYLLTASADKLYMKRSLRAKM